jgi:type IV pilus assembly protein PilA
MACLSILDAIARSEGRKRAQAGFSAIELVIVVGIITLLGAIAAPHLFRARSKANEVSAVASMRAINAAQDLYQNTYPKVGYSASLKNLGNNGSTCESTSATNACLLDSTLAGGFKNGYLFNLLGDGKTPDLSYTLSVFPESSNSGDCAYFMNQSGQIQSSPPPLPVGLQSGATPSGGSACGGN